MDLDNVQFDPQRGFLTRGESLSSLFSDEAQQDLDQIRVPVRHEKYYIESGDVVFQVGFSLFCPSPPFFPSQYPFDKNKIK